MQEMAARRPETDASEGKAPTPASPRSPRTKALLEGAIVPTLVRLSSPNILVTIAQASTGLVETWWVSKLGTDALAGMAVVFPVVMLHQMMSQGANPDATAPKPPPAPKAN